MRFGRYGRNPGWYVLAALAAIYGLLVAFGPGLGGSDTAWDRFTVWGGLACLVIFVVIMVIPFVRWVTSADRA